MLEVRAGGVTEKREGVLVIDMRNEEFECLLQPLLPRHPGALSASGFKTLPGVEHEEVGMGDGSLPSGRWLWPLA